MVFDGIDRGKIKPDELSAHLAECIRYQVRLEKPQATATGLSNSPDKKYLDKDAGLKQIYDDALVRRAGPRQLTAPEMLEQGIGAHAPQTVGNCVVKNANAGMRDRLSDALYEKVRKAESKQVMDALPAIQQASFENRLVRKRTQQIDISIKTVRVSNQNEDDTAREIAARLAKRTPEQRQEILNDKSGAKPVLCAALLGDGHFRTLPKIAAKLIEAGADLSLAVKWMIAHEPGELLACQKALAELPLDPGRLAQPLITLEQAMVDALAQERVASLAAIAIDYRAALRIAAPEAGKQLEAALASVNVAESTRAGLNEALTTMSGLRERVMKILFGGDGDGDAPAEAAEALRPCWQRRHARCAGMIEEALALDTGQADELRKLYQDAQRWALADATLLKAIRQLNRCHAQAGRVVSLEGFLEN